MKNSLILAGSLLLLIATAFLIKECGKEEIAGNPGGAQAHPGIHQPRRPPLRVTASDEKSIFFPGFAPIHYDSTKSVNIKEFAGDPRYLADCDEAGVSILSRNQVNVFLSEDGTIRKIEKGIGRFPSVSRHNEVVARFKKQGVTITRLGNDFARLNNKWFMRGLTQELAKCADWPETTLESDLVPTFEVEVFPIMFMLDKSHKSPYLEKEVELPGLLWKTKKREVRGDLKRYWRDQPMAVEDARPVFWAILPLVPEGVETASKTCIETRSSPGIDLHELKILDDSALQSGSQSKPNDSN